MRKRISKSVAIGMTLFSALALVACGNKDNESKGVKTTEELESIEDRYTVDSETPSWKLDTKEEKSLTWYVNADWWNTDFGEDLVTQKIKEDLNLDIKFITGDDTNLNTYFASGDLPDVITIFDSNSDVARDADQWALPLQDLADSYDPYFYEVASEETLDWYQLNDGKTYGYPNYSNSATDYESGDIFAKDAFIIRKDVYEAIGEPDMTTPEGFIDAMNAISNEFPELTPFGFNEFAQDGSSNGSMDGTIQDMLGIPYTDEDGNFYDRNLDDEYINWIKAFRQVREDGNINDDSFTDTGDAFNEKIQTGKYASIMMGSFVNLASSLQTFASSNPDSQYIAVDAIQNSNGNQPTLSQEGISGWMISYISNQTKDPATAIQVFTYLLDDYGQMLTNFGVEDETYEVISDDPIEVEFTDEAKEVQLNDSDKWQTEYRIGEFILFGHDRYKAYSNDSYVNAIMQMQEWGDGKLTPQFATENINPDSGSPEARALSNIQTNWGTTLVSMLRSDNDETIDQLLEKHISFQEDNNIDTINEARNAKIQENKEKLGID